MDAAARSWLAFKPEGNVAKDLVVFGIGAVLRLMSSGEDVALEDIAAAAAYGIFAVGLALCGSFIWYLFSAPYRAHLKVENRCTEMRHKIRDYEVKSLESKDLRELGRKMRELIDRSSLMIDLGPVGLVEYDQWLSAASTLTGEWDEGEKHMLETRSSSVPDLWSDKRDDLGKDTVKLRAIMGRVFDEAKRRDEEAKKFWHG